MGKKFVIVVDTQYDFVMQDGLLSVPGAEEIIAPGIRFLASLKPEEIEGVFFSYDTHTPDVYMGSAENVGDESVGRPGFPIHCVKDTPGWQNVFNPELVHEDIPVFTMIKGVNNQWEEDGLSVLGSGGVRVGERDEFFNVLKRVDTVVVIGVATDFCVKWAILGLVERGFKVEVPAHLTRGIVREIDQLIADEFPEGVSVI